MINQIRRAMNERDKGFTLIELLVVIIIIGILAAIAIPVFLNQRKKAVEASLKADLKSAAIVQDTLAGGYAEQGLNTRISVGRMQTEGGFKLSPGNSMFVWGGAMTGYCLIAWNPGASTSIDQEHAMSYDSLMGGLNQRGGACVVDVFQNGWTGYL